MNKPETLDPTWSGKLYAQNSTQKKTVQFYGNRDGLKKQIFQNIMAQYIIQDDIIEYEKETSEFAARIIGFIKDGVK